MNSTFISYILLYSAMYGVDPKLVASIIQVESSGVPSKHGALGEIGLMQLRPEYFHYPKGYLKDPKHNIAVGVRYLASLQKTCPHKVDKTFVICFNLGVRGASHIKHPKQFKYYKRVIKVYRGYQ